jgi:hypothetical protein
VCGGKYMSSKDGGADEDARGAGLRAGAGLTRAGAGLASRLRVDEQALIVQDPGQSHLGRDGCEV